MRSMVEGAGAHHDFDVQACPRIAPKDVFRGENIESALVCIAQAAAPSTAFGGPPPP